MPYIFLGLSFFLTILGFFSSFGYWYDLSSHFRLQYFLFQLFCIVLCLIQRRWHLIKFVIVFALINVAMILPYYFPREKPKNPNYAIPVKILLINVERNNTHYEAVRNLIKKISPDILALEEIDERWAKELRPVLKNFPKYKQELENNNFGIGLYSKWPLRDVKLKYFALSTVPSIVAKLTVDRQPVSVILTHPLPPVTYDYFAWRNKQFDGLAALVPELEKNAILLGDLNCSCWSYHLQSLLNTMGLKDTREGFGLQTTWPSFMGRFGLTLDHVLVSKNFLVSDRKVGPDIGSDHLPVIIELILK